MEEILNMLYALRWDHLRTIKDLLNDKEQSIINDNIQHFYNVTTEIDIVQERLDIVNELIEIIITRYRIGE